MSKLGSKGSSLIVGLLIVVVVAVVVGAGFYVYNENKKSDKPLTTSQQEAKQEPEATKDPTADWVVYKDTGGMFEFKHPPSWVIADNLNLCTPSLVLLGANKDAVGKCASDGGGQMSVYAQAGDQSANYALKKEYYPDVNTKLATVNGAIGVKQFGTYQPAEESFGIGPQVGDKVLVYSLLKDNITYIAQYNIKKNNPYPDVQSDFETLVTKTLKFKQ